MGRLIPGATYIYERDGGTTYAREFGSAKREVIGMDYPCKNNIKEELLWRDILVEAKSNPTLQSALDRAIMLYNLSKEHHE